MEPDHDLERLFRDARVADERAVPAFAKVVAPRAAAPRAVRLRVAALAAAAMVFAALLWWWRAAPNEPDLVIAFTPGEMRVPTDYRFWTSDFDYFHPDEAVLAYFDRYLEACQARSFHLSLNLHRAAGFTEVGIQRRHGRLDGEWKDTILVERLLGEAAR